MSSPLNMLSDGERERIRHMIRRDAHTDPEIAGEVEAALAREGAKKTSLGPTDAAKKMVIVRYRRSKPFQKWLKAWEERDTDLQKAVALQKQRFELVSELVGATPNDKKMDTVAKSIQARLLTLAAEADDDQLVEAAAGRGWIKTLLKVVQDQTAQEQKVAGEKAVAVVQDTKLSEEEREKRMKEIFGIV